MRPYRLFALVLGLTLMATLGTLPNPSLAVDPRAPGAADDRLSVNGHANTKDIEPSPVELTDSHLPANRMDGTSTSTITAIQITPRSGVPGSEVRIQGAGFTAASTVIFGGTALPLSSVTYVAPTQLRALVPAVNGLVAVRVTTGGETTSAEAFSVLAPLQGKTLINVTAGSLPARLAQTNNGLFVDADNDADLDLFVSENAPAYPLTPIRRMRLLMNDGAGQFTDETDVRMPSMLGTPRQAQSGDIDADGDQDILANSAVGYTPPSHPGSLLINDGSGHFSDEWSSRVPRVECPIGVLGDVDGDGDLDLLLPCWPTDQQVFLNDGSGYFAPGGTFPVLPYDSGSFALGDVDDDGDLDALGVWPGSNVNQRADLLYINDGHGNFVDETATRLPDSSGYNGAQSVLADLDRDGDLDGIILGSSHDPDYVLVNDGTGRFTRSPQLLPAIYANFWLGGVEVGDIDSDGDIDLALPDPVNGKYTETILLLNQGNAQFEEPSQQLYPFLRGACRDQGGTGNKICESAALGDVNSDGALDLFLARIGGSDTVQQSLLFEYLQPERIFLPAIRLRAQ